MMLILLLPAFAVTFTFFFVFVFYRSSYIYQLYKVPQFNQHFQPNHLYRKVTAYLTSLPATEDSDFANLFSGPKPGDITLHLDHGQVVRDRFFGSTLWWTFNESHLVLKVNKKDKKRILRPYLQHILAEIEQRKYEISLYLNLRLEPETGRRWSSGIPFTNPATMDTVVMEADLKSKVKSDLETFLKSKQYYHRIGRVWKRSYLLHGAQGTGKSTFVAAMARFLNYDVYEIDFSKSIDDSDLKTLLLQTTNRSMIVIEDVDRLIADKKLNKRGLMNLISSCGEERVMVLTARNKVEDVRTDFDIEFKHCNFSAFKSLATSYLGVKEHKLFGQVEEMFETTSLSAAEIGEIMMSNRSSPSRALKSVISAMRRSESSSSSPPSGEIDGGSVHTMSEFRKLYGLLKMGSRRKQESNSGHGV